MPRSRPKLHQGGVDGDPMKPRRKPRIPLERPDRLERGDQGILHRVPRVVVVPEEPARHAEQASRVSPDEKLESRLIPGAKPREEISVLRRLGRLERSDGILPGKRVTDHRRGPPRSSATKADAP